MSCCEPAEVVPPVNAEEGDLDTLPNAALAATRLCCCPVMRSRGRDGEHGDLRGRWTDGPLSRHLKDESPSENLQEATRTYFTFDGTIYEQVKGTPMGSPMSEFIAEAVLQRLESLVFQHHKPKFWARYVDDTFVVIDRDQLLTFKERLNAVFPDIQFTMEE
ncbi:hypothetical protein SprV_0200846100 [Sparganum proliferum]